MKKFFINIFAAIVLCLPVIVFAAATSDIGLQNPIKVNSISELVLIVTRVIRYIAIPFVIIMIMWSGFQYIWATKTGKPVGISEANKTLMYTLLGTFILLSSELIALIIKNTIEGLTK